MIDYFPTRLIPLVRSWCEQRQGLSLDDRYDLSDYAGVTLDEIDAAIAYVFDNHEEEDPRLTTTEPEE